MTRCDKCGQVIKPAHYGGGRVPYGFTRVDGALTFSEYTGPVLVWLIQHHSLGLTYREIADRANAFNIPAPTGGLWTFQTAWRVVKRGRSLAHLIPAQYLSIK